MNIEKLRDDIQQAVQSDPHGPNAELLSKCFAMIGVLAGFKTAYMAWQDKTDWVQDEISAGAHPDGFRHLGKHRADVMTKMIRDLREKSGERRVNNEQALDLPVGTVQVGDHLFNFMKFPGGIEAMYFGPGHQIHYTTTGGAVERKHAHGFWSAWKHCEEYSRLFKEIDK